MRIVSCSPPKLSRTVRLSLAREVEAKRAIARLHQPGDGWHYLPTRAEYIHNGSYWFATLGTSEGPVLANVVDLCTALGIEFAILYRTAYPEDGSVPEVTHEDRAMRAREATLSDAALVLQDLTAVNYHPLQRALGAALRARGIEPTSA